MGGIWFPASTELLKRPAIGSAAKSSTNKGAGPILWRAKFDGDITRDLVSYENPRGTITNSDLELAAAIVQHNVAAHQFDIRERTIASGSGNTPTVAWQTKGSLLPCWPLLTYCNSRLFTNAFTATILHRSLLPGS
jgi:hypothetical protein